RLSLSVSDQRVRSIAGGKLNYDRAELTELVMASAVAASHQPAASVMARVDRLDLVVGHLEEMRRGGGGGRRSSCGGSPSTTTTTVSSNESGSSSVASTPRGMSCRPAKEALEEARAKGSLVDRIASLETRVLKMEEEMEVTSSDVRNTGSDEKQQRSAAGNKKAEKRKRLKSLVKSCVRGKLNTND
ncbi:Os03g0623100, partial [Oryza sativa Japonica Group]